MKVPDLSVVIPVYNEAAIVRAACEELCARLDRLGWDYEILFAENGSRDDTLQILQALSRERPRIHWLHEDEPNYGRALKRGILQARGRHVVCDEIDLCDVSFYERALPILVSGADLVIGSKAMKGANDARPLVRRAATRIVTLLLRIATGFRGTDTHGVKAFVRERIVPVAAACKVERDLFASELVVRAQRMGRNVKEIPIALREKRPPGVHLVRRVPRVLKGLWQLGWAIRRGK
jgi:glycosyltransferase involved in cell wall biosynthesis